MEYTITYLKDLNEEHKKEAMRIFTDGFYPLFSSITKDRNIMAQFFARSFDVSRSYVYLDKDQVTGFIAVGDCRKRSVKIKRDVCRQLFGKWKGNMIYRQLGALFNTVNVTAERTCYIEFLVTDKNRRGSGVGTRLLEYVLSLPEYDICTLDVLEKNLTAKRLYEKTGFVPINTRRDLVKYIRGFGRTIFMEYQKR